MWGLQQWRLAYPCDADARLEWLDVIVSRKQLLLCCMPVCAPRMPYSIPVDQTPSRKISSLAKELTYPCITIYPHIFHAARNE